MSVCRGHELANALYLLCVYMLIKLGQNIVFLRTRQARTYCVKVSRECSFKEKEKKKNNEEDISTIYYNFFEQGKACWRLKILSYKNVKRLARGQ